MLLRIKKIDQPLPGQTAHGFPELQIKQSDQIRYDCWETVREELTKKEEISASRCLLFLVYSRDAHQAEAKNNNKLIFCDPPPRAWHIPNA